MDRLRIRVERLFHGDVRNDDLFALFLAFRDMPNAGPHSIEIGNFLAHQGERNKGPIATTAIDLMTILKFQLRKIKGEPIVYDQLPQEFLRVVRAGAKYLEKRSITGETGLKGKKLTENIKSAIGKLIERDDRTLILAPLTTDEKKILDALSLFLISRPVFSARELFRDFTNTLKRNGLILNNSESKLLKVQEEKIMVFSISAMHLTKIDCNFPDKASLVSGYSYNNDRRVLDVSIDQDFLFKENKSGVSFPLLTTDLVADDWCDAPLLRPQKFKRPDGVMEGTRPNRVWWHPLEMNSSGKLTYLVSPRYLNDPALQPYSVGSDVDEEEASSLPQ